MAGFQEIPGIIQSLQDKYEFIDVVQGDDGFVTISCTNDVQMKKIKDALRTAGMSFSANSIGLNIDVDTNGVYAINNDVTRDRPNILNDVRNRLFDESISDDEIWLVVEDATATGVSAMQNAGVDKPLMKGKMIRRKELVDEVSRKIKLKKKAKSIIRK